MKKKGNNQFAKIFQTVMFFMQKPDFFFPNIFFKYNFSLPHLLIYVILVVTEHRLVFKTMY